MKIAALLLISLLLSGCAHTWSPVDYGVQPNGQASMLRDGTVYYRTGDECALRHELFHVMHGGQHTVEYHQHLIQGTGRVCPV